MSRIDRFVEHLLSRYKLDLYERAEVETKFRDYLSGFIDQGLALGFDRDRAECEAIRQFQYRSYFARLFNLPDCRLFLAISGAFPAIPVIGLFWMVALDRPSDSEAQVLSWLSLLLMPAFGFILAYMLTQKWIIIKNGIIFRPRPNPKFTFFVPFDQLFRIVKPPWGNMIEFRYEGGHRFVPTWLQRLRADLVVIDALAPGVIDPELTASLRKLKTPLRAESGAFRAISTLGWLAVIGIFATGLPLMWAGDGYPWPVALALACAPLIALAHTSRLPHRPRAAMLNIIGLAQLPALCILFFSATLNADIFQMRQWALIISLCFAMALIAAWWRGGVKPLLAISACFIAFFFGMRDSIRPQCHVDQVVLSSEASPACLRWLDQGETAVWVENVFQPERCNDLFFVTSRNGSWPVSVKLPYVSMYMKAAPPGKVFAAYHRESVNVSEEEQEMFECIGEDEDDIGDDDVELPASAVSNEPYTYYLNTVSTDNVLETATLPIDLSRGYYRDTGWSPGGRYLCAGRSSEYDTETTIPCMDTHTGAVIDTSFFDGRGRILWTGPHTFRLCRVTTDTIRLQEIDIEAKRVRTIQVTRRDHDREFFGYSDILDGLRYAISDANLLDLESGERLKIPLTIGNAFQEYDWDPNSSRLAYATNYEESQHYYWPCGTIAVYHVGRGIVARHDFDSPRYVSDLKLSPDGRRVYVVSRSADPCLDSWITATTHTEVIDLATHRSQRLASVFTSNGYAPSAVWSPDSRKLLYLSTIRTGRRFYTNDVVMLARIQ